jgi:hypothetical protein
MNRFATRTIALAAAATLAVMLAGIGVAVGSPAGDHARVAALSRAVKKLDGRFDELKGELNDLHNADESNRQGVSYLRRALIAPNVVKVVETRPLEEGGEVTVDAFCPRHFQVINGSYVPGASNGEVHRAAPIQPPRPGYEVCGVSMVGDAEIVRGVDALRLVRHVHRRYIDEARDLPGAVRGFLESDDVAVRFRPQSAFTWDQRGTEGNIRCELRLLHFLFSQPTREP